MTDRLKEIDDKIDDADIHTFSTYRNGGEVVHYVMFPVPDIRYLLDRVRELEDLADGYVKSECHGASLPGPPVQAVINIATGRGVQVEKLEAENVRLREALEFYAERENHIVHDGEGPFTMIENDDGRRARKALGME